MGFPQKRIRSGLTLFFDKGYVVIRRLPYYGSETALQKIPNKIMLTMLGRYNRAVVKMERRGRNGAILITMSIVLCSCVVNGTEMRESLC
jgi:hypothetical protein